MICIAGKNEIAVSALLHLIEQGWREQLLVCPSRSDTGRSNWQPSLIRFADEFKIPIVSLDSIYRHSEIIFISLEFDRLIKVENFKSEHLYNIHFSYLPAFKGVYTSAMPILTGALSSGVTLHKIDNGIDTGPIIAQTPFDIPDNCTARELYFLYLEHSKALFRRSIDSLLRKGEVHLTPQPAQGSTYYSKNTIDYSHLKIDVNDTAEGIVRQLRAFSFREYQVPKISTIEIGGWSIADDRSEMPPGHIIQLDRNLFLLSSIDYNLYLWRDRSAEWFDWVKKEDDLVLDDMDIKQIDLRNEDGHTPLILAAYKGDFKKSLALLELGADPDKGNLNGTTPLMYSHSSINPDDGLAVAKELRRFGANDLLPDRFGKTLFDYHPGLH